VRSEVNKKNGNCAQRGHEKNIGPHGGFTMNGEKDAWSCLEVTKKRLHGRKKTKTGGEITKGEKPKGLDKKGGTQFWGDHADKKVENLWGNERGSRGERRGEEGETPSLWCLWKGKRGKWESKNTTGGMKRLAERHRGAGESSPKQGGIRKKWRTHGLESFAFGRGGGVARPKKKTKRNTKAHLKKGGETFSQSTSEKKIKVLKEMGCVAGRNRGAKLRKKNDLFPKLLKKKQKKKNPKTLKKKPSKRKKKRPDVLNSGLFTVWGGGVTKVSED